ncbi:hypothetical protein OIE66_35860 [Nonomuraea sp. NBC_01738]|uniref:hypothetical protein n=1 Tax=Nonomuraea sp. NBC_01738 TaxID=2976003 RepID=UPI002E134462|nr:hypothetical protein OIE66_35860 [Nonomuraea sp. NBC_01738]
MSTILVDAEGKTAEWGAAVLRVRRVAYAGAIVMVGLVGCTAEATTGPTGTPSAGTSPSATATVTPTSTPTRAGIEVQLNPDKVTAGETSRVWILANCPVPTGGPAHTGTATSKAFISGVTLNPTTPTASPSATGNGATPTAAPLPWVRGQAQVSGTVKRGSYTVEVKCDGTNDRGKATLRVVKATDDVPTGVPTKAPKAGGGGMFGKDADDGSSIPLAPAGVLVALALAAGIGLAVKRRRA